MIRGIRGDDSRAVSPLIGAGVAVALVLFAVSVVTMVILGAGEATDDGPDIEFSFEYNDNASATTEDSFGNTGGSFDGLLTITIEDGDVVRAEQLLITGATAESGRAPFGPDGGYAPEAEVGSGDTVTVWVDGDDSVTVLFHDLDTDESSRLDRWTGDDS